MPARRNLGSVGSGIVVAASDTPPELHSHADFVCDGVADDEEIQAAIDLCAAEGGEIVLLGGLYNLAVGLTFTVNKRIIVRGQGAILSLAAGLTGILINQGSLVPARGVVLEGLRIVGNNSSTAIGVELRDTNWSVLSGVQIEDCGRGILMHCFGTNEFVEGVTLEDVVIRNCSVYGIEYRRTGGTNSFGQHNYRNVNINVGDAAVGFYLASACSIYRCRMEVGVWIGTNDTAFSLDGDADNLYADFYVEGATGSTGNTAVLIGTNATGFDKALIHFSFWGTINTVFSNAFNKDFWYRDGRVFKGLTQNTTAPIRVSSHLDSAAKITLGINGVAGGRITLGNGSGTNDVYIERNAANKMVAAGKWKASSLNLQVKAGAPADGDITGGAEDGDVVVDTSNSRIYVRVGGTWKFVAVA